MSNRPNNPNYSRIGTPTIPICSVNGGDFHLSRYWAKGKHESSYLMIEKKGIGYRLDENVFTAFLAENYAAAKSAVKKNQSFTKKR